MTAHPEIYRMRAYTEGNPVRLAAVLTSLEANRVPGTPITRDQIAELWARWWPGHAAHTANAAIRARMRRALPYLRGAGICHSAGPDIVVIDNTALLMLAAANLKIVTDDTGENSLTPTFWRGVPSVPADLQAFADQRAAARAALALATAGSS